ncbi:hypothetical protein IW140_003522 [Coemansia sp. RSA 1813]|nr:hypothetical protein EV178_003389 [Coemansia sp. RSA 1646]KAJ1772937.1 hypothetical protein LPJ74_001078 [Coemansia sp. RSA 1843]KAJ2093513.1 hypothetical protein IW138_000366 [Coemansia sp. RSA 986]KAJ2214330.1 hypothetical protein EV179_003112 [Coemansia sp. RSA 487]KAJ2568896.1 hypothetical protein IW140_003522 [Coemansia sp. RSA 1813]
MVDIIADYYDNVDSIPPRSTVSPGYLSKVISREVPEEPETFEDIKSDIDIKIMPGITHWQSGNFFGWFPSINSFPCMLGEMYCNMFSIVAFSWGSSPAATELEAIVMDSLGKLIGLNKRFMALNEDGTESNGGGVIQGSACEAQCVVMLAARERKISHLISQGMDIEDAEQLKGKFVAYGSDQTHSGTQKNAKVIGCRIRLVPSDKNCSLAKESLEAAVAEDRSLGLIPFYVCGTFGTTNTTAIDDITGIADVASSEDMWFHVDAAYAGSALVCPEIRPLAAGIERADSFDLNLHKWTPVNFDCSALWLADATYLTKALSIQREYLPRTKTETSFAKDYRDWQIPLSRRFRSLKVWFVLRMYGAKGIRKHVKAHIIQAKWLEQQLIADNRFEIIAPVVFGLVVFRIKPCALGSNVSTEEANIANTELVNRIHEDNRVFLLGTHVKGLSVLRAAIGATFDTQKNVKLLLQVIKELTTSIIKDKAVR